MIELIQQLHESLLKEKIRFATYSFQVLPTFKKQVIRIHITQSAQFIPKFPGHKIPDPTTKIVILTYSGFVNFAQNLLEEYMSKCNFLLICHIMTLYFTELLI